MRFNHLHVHSYYSLQDAIPSPAELALAAAQNGITAIAQTDHLKLSGAVEFQLACHQYGIQPIHGPEIDLELPVRLTVKDRVSGPARLQT